MDLVGIREKFIKMSGRYDLVTSTATWADNGADFFINAGLKMLDKRINAQQSQSRIYETVAAGSFYVTFQLCRAIQEVWVTKNSSDQRWKLEFKNINGLWADYNELISAMDAGEPEYWCPGYVRSPESTDKDDQGAFLDHVVAAPSLYNMILFAPPTDGEYTVEVWGLYDHANMVNNTDVNYWSETHPHLLLYAALYQLEVSYRNTEGANDWMNALMTELTDLDKDIVEQEIYENTVINEA